MTYASRLSLSNAGVDRETAYEIVVLLLETENGGTNEVLQCAKLVFSRLGNFPALQLTTSRYDFAEDNFRNLFLSLEGLTRETENTVVVRGKEIILTDFQEKLFRTLNRHQSVSVSAPTSAGKSFLLGLEIIRQISELPGAIVFVVPTRALIRQVMRDILSSLRRFNVTMVDVLCVPEAVDPSVSNRGLIYVFTQERLINLLNSPESTVPISFLVVDEAQEVGDDQRGILLQSAIEQALKENSECKVLFASPLRSNPGFLLGLFGRDREGEFFVESSSPVSQTLILVDQVERKPKLGLFSFRMNEERQSMGCFELPFKFRGKKSEVLANFAATFTGEEESSIVFCDGARDAEKNAEELCAIVDELKAPSKKVDDLISFVKSHIHQLHPLVRTLRYGVAAHYGYMPEMVRASIEELFHEGEIRFVCCTSTLLQGVNLPAKHVFMLKPTRGKNPIDRGSFWNLAGRAGRMAREYRGNVWCISPDCWDENPIDGDKMTELSAAFQSQLSTALTDVVDAANATDRPAENAETAKADQTFGKLFSDLTLNNESFVDSKYCDEANRAQCEVIDTVCSSLKARLSSIRDVVVRHHTISPHRIEELHLQFMTAESLRDLVPIHPLRKDGYQRLKEIFKLLDDVFFKTGNKSFEFHTWLASQWLRERPLGDLIQDVLERGQNTQDPVEISKTIRDLLESLEKEIRFKYVKYLRLYHDLLVFHFELKGESEEAEKVLPLHLYLEFGACSETLIRLMGFGLSRTTAIEVRNNRGLDGDATLDKCRQALVDITDEDTSLPNLVMDEVRSLLS